ncbi:hypothetical protein HDA40_002170 [Hamadaea flava]|uniref:Uncharacterized protein n=1 Tax=Hamadaea flava TaxID=1742688 RepID=A0ABV8LL61_9ACTN|nr:hypothetical protein [Hamadaea flava]MCP2323663.1 hypothetical protein [Hamadaea flava]
MGRQPSRHDVAAARRAYTAAVGRVQRAMTGYHAAGIPLSTDLALMAMPWSREQIGAVVELRDAWIELTHPRRGYERILREDAG